MTRAGGSPIGRIDLRHLKPLVRHPLIRRSVRALLRSTGTRQRLLVEGLRHRGLRPDDLFLASYPRSGNTWLRFLVYQAITGREATFESVDKAIPYVGEHAEAPSLLPTGGRLIKTHERHHPVYRRAVYLVRDPGDVLLSDYRYNATRGEYVGDFDRFVEDFLAGRVHGFGSWVDHVRSWTESGLGPNGLLVLRFEEMRADPTATLARVLEFLGIERPPSAITAAVEANTVERMRAKEERRPPARPSADFRMVHRGEVGAWRGELSVEHASRVRRQAEEALARLPDR